MRNLKSFFLIVLLILIYLNVKADWVHIGNGLPADNIYAYAINSNTIFLGVNSNGIYKSTDGGTNWNYSGSGLQNTLINDLFIDGNKMFCGTLYGAFVSTNAGNYWEKIVNGLGDYYVMCFGKTNNFLYLGCISDGLFKSSDNGISWINVNNFPAPWIKSMAFFNSALFVGTSGVGKLYKTLDNGANWSLNFTINAVSGSILDLEAENQYLYMIAFADGYGSTIFRTVDGNYWIEKNNGINNLFLYDIDARDSLVVLGTSSNVYFSQNNGDNWISITQGLPGDPVYTVFFYEQYIIAATPYHLYKRPINEVLVDISNNNTVYVKDTKLSQNYPNPFNPTTKIKFDVVRVGDVKIVVYDVMGREVQTLVNESLKPGTYESTLDGTTLNSGVYFYKIAAGNFVETKKMLMIK